MWRSLCEIDHEVLLWGLLKELILFTCSVGTCVHCHVLPTLSVENSMLLLAGVTSNVALNIAVTVVL